MNVKWVENVYVRHVDDESIVWHPRSGGCTVMRNVRVFLDMISHLEYKNIDDILNRVARVFDCVIDDIREDFICVLKELVSQGFVIHCEDDKQRFIEIDAAKRLSYKENELSEKNQPALGVFYSRHQKMFELHLDVTDRCNERCVHCYIPQGGGNLMPKEMAFKVLREFREMSGLSVLVSGGECLLHPDIALILREAKRLDLNIIVLSNLAHCDEKMVALLKEIDPQFINVSLYSMNEQEHDDITRVSGSWQRTMCAIMALKDAGVHIRLATPILRANATAIPALLEFANSNGMHDIFDCDIIGRIDHDCSNQNHALRLEELCPVIKCYRDVLLNPCYTPTECAPDAKVCSIGEGHLNINAKGDYYPCDGFHGCVLGNARDDSLFDVWSSEKLNSLRNLKNKDFKKCVHCENRPWCKVCAMRNFNETGDMLTPTPTRCALAELYRKVEEEK